MTEWCTEHPVMTFLIVMFIISQISISIAIPWGRKKDDGQ